MDGHSGPDRNAAGLVRDDAIRRTTVPAGIPPEMCADTAQDPRREPVERFTKEVAPLITSGPGRLAGGADQSLRVDTQGRLLGVANLDLQRPRSDNGDDMTN